MFTEILISFLTIGLAEMGDVTQISTIMVSPKVKNKLHLLIGIMFGYLVVDGIAIFLGSWVTQFFLIHALRWVIAFIFILLGILLLKEALSGKNDLHDKLHVYPDNPFLTGFVLIMLTEWGDKTPIASALLATKYNPLLVLVGSMLAFLATSLAAIYFGSFITEKLGIHKVTILSGIVFIIVGFGFILF